MSSGITCLLVPVEGEIEVIPYTSTTIRDYLGPHYEGICFSKPNYRLSGFIKMFDASPVNKRCTDIYVAEIRGTVIIADEHPENEDDDEDEEYLKSLTSEDIPKIFNC
jgi:hypothetical protein